MKGQWKVKRDCERNMNMIFRQECHQLEDEGALDGVAIIISWVRSK